MKTINCYFYNTAEGSGVTNGVWANDHLGWNNYVLEEKPGNNGNPDSDSWWAQIVAKNLLHEIIHRALWRHPFEGNDFCEDTPTLPRCWGRDANNPNCDEEHEISTNLMDYNQYIPWHLSPCQVCRLQQHLENNEPDLILQEGEACAPPSAFFDTPEEVWYSDKYNRASVQMEGTASFNETMHFIEIYEVNAVGRVL